MPIFEYFCSDCTNKFEFLKRTEWEGRPACPKCSNKNTKQLFSSFSALTSNKNSVTITPEQVLNHAGLGERSMNCSVCRIAAETTCEIINGVETNN